MKASIFDGEKPRSVPTNQAKMAMTSHLGACQKEYVEHRHIEFGDINAVENEAWKDDVEGQLGERCDVHIEFPVHEVSDCHEYEKRKDVVCNDL